MCGFEVDFVLGDFVVYFSIFIRSVSFATLTFNAFIPETISSSLLVNVCVWSSMDFILCLSKAHSVFNWLYSLSLCVPSVLSLNVDNQINHSSAYYRNSIT